MSQQAIWSMTGAEQARAIRDKRLSSREVVEAILTRIDQLNPTLNAYCTLNERALDDATAADQAAARGEALGSLHGVPVSIKDLVLTRGLRTTFGSRLFADYVPDEDDVVVERLRNAGAIILGKTNVPEFGYNATTDNLLFGPSRNPWNPALTPGGSSGGAGAAVAAGLGSLAVGSDGGGSVRIPSGLCGLFGLKASFGRVPLYPGCRVPDLPGGSSWESVECIGPMTRTVEDGALMLSVMAGEDARDRHSLPGSSFDYLGALRGDLRGLRVAWSPDWGYATVDPEVRGLTTRAALAFGELGCTVEEAHPGFEDPSAAFWATVARDTDLRALRAICRDRREQLSDSPLIDLLNTEWSAEDFTDAAMVRQRLYTTLRRFMERFDLLLTPTLPVAAFEVGRFAPERIGDKTDVTLIDWLPFTFPLNLTGQPAATVPAGLTQAGLPVGLQIIGRRLDDVTVLRAAAAFEQARPWAHLWPALAGSEASAR